VPFWGTIGLIGGGMKGGRPPMAPNRLSRKRAMHGQQRGAVGPRDVPAEIEDPDAMD
jgi:hypothetical protein